MKSEPIANVEHAESPLPPWFPLAWLGAEAAIGDDRFEPADLSQDNQAGEEP